MRKLYLAGPYTHPEQSVMDKRAEMHTEAFALLACPGTCVYSPIVQTHSVCKKYSLPVTWDYWETFDTEFIKWCKTLVVLKIEGWDTSKGTQAEIAIARLLGKTVEMVTMEQLRAGQFQPATIDIICPDCTAVATCIEDLPETIQCYKCGFGTSSISVRDSQHLQEDILK